MIQLYWKNATSKMVGSRHGVSEADLEKAAPEIKRSHQAVVQQCRTSKLGYAALPTRSEYRDSVMELVDRYRDHTTDLVVLGIGGSALGNIALQAALNPSNYNLLSDAKRPGPRLFVLDNVDPALVEDTLKFISRRLSTTLINVISKSGETAETASQFMIFREKMRKKLGEGFGGRIVATTDTAKGTLHDIAKADGYAMLAVPGDVGGRFSVLSPVGLFSAAMCGIDIDELLAGAGAMKARVESENWQTNPACMLAVIKYIAFSAKKKTMHVMMPYSNRLYMLADWYRQIWAESLGKATDRNGENIFTGPTPIKALGATDQHSQVQLYREGPNDKLTVFLEVAEHPDQVRVPNVFEDVPGLTYLRRKKLSKLLNVEKLATEYAMAVSKRPTVTIRFDKITPHSVGEFIYLYEFTTSLMGELLNIDAYNQPAVELGKQATFALMRREGFTHMSRKINRFAKVDEKYLT